jgi:hypothetical protein
MSWSLTNQEGTGETLAWLASSVPQHF